MRTTKTAALRTLAVISMAAACGLPTPFDARAGRRYTYSYEPRAEHKGELEYEQWVTARLEKEDSSFRRWDFRHELEYGLTDVFSLGYNLGAEWTTENDSTLSSFVYTVALGAGLTDSWGAYVEFFGDIGLSASGTANYFDGGFTYLVAENVQLDVFAGVGLSDDADDWFVGAGVSYRLPN